MQGGANVSDPIKRYVFLRMKLNAMRYLIPAVPVTLVFLITALRYDALEYDLLFALLPLAIAAIALCISMYQPVRFLRMVRNQEAMFGVAFGEKKFAPLIRVHPTMHRRIGSSAWGHGPFIEAT